MVLKKIIYFKMYNTFTIKNALLNKIIFIAIAIVQLPFLKLMFQGYVLLGKY